MTNRYQYTTDAQMLGDFGIVRRITYETHIFRIALQQIKKLTSSLYLTSGVYVVKSADV